MLLQTLHDVCVLNYCYCITCQDLLNTFHVKLDEIRLRAGAYPFFENLLK